MLVYVQNRSGKPQMPTQRLGAVRHWLKSGRAVVVRREPFIIRLLDQDDAYTQPLRAGVDLGTSHVGISVVSVQQEGFASEFKLRTDMSGLLTDRRMCRRKRRNRKTRHRAPRFLNRRQHDELAPSVRAKVEETLKVFRLVGSLLPITTWSVETGNFDVHKLVNPEVAGATYQQGEQYNFENTREYVLWRDHHTCQNPKCDHADLVLTIHHRQQRTDGGSDRPANLVTLCKTCHRGHHNKQPLDLPPPPGFRNASQFNVVKAYVMRALTHLQYEATFGYITKAKRMVLGLPKSHINDAFIIAGGQQQTRVSATYTGAFFRRQNRKLFKGARSHIRNTIPSAMGFKRGDRVRMRNGKEGFIVGLRSSGKFDVRRLDGAVLHHAVSHKLLRRLEGTRTLRIERCIQINSERRGAFPPAVQPADVSAQTL
jgi:hypothetical protein